MGGRPVVVVVDDDAPFLAMMREVLADEGLAVRGCQTIESALAAIREVVPALVVLDLVIERRDDGWRVLDALALDPATRAVPVVVCSADAVALAEHAPRLRRAGAATLAKPFNVDDLLALVQRLVPRPASEDWGSATPAG